MAIEICGGNRVQGEIEIQGSKNAVLPMMAAALLCDGETVIRHCPDITDVHAMAGVIRGIGGTVTLEQGVLKICTDCVNRFCVEEKAVRDIRASVLLLGSLISRFGAVQIQYPGGCSIGSRPIDLHLKAFRTLGIRTVEGEEYIECREEQARQSTGRQTEEKIVSLVFPSVGATENILLAAVKRAGITKIVNAAREPEIEELCRFLCAMGADIKGAGTKVIRIRGVRHLCPVTWQLSPDRIVFFSYAMLTAGCGGDAFFYTEEKIPEAEEEILLRIGCSIQKEEQGIRIRKEGAIGAVPYLCTKPYPGFPTDGQSPLMAVLCRANGVSTIEEGIFENRLRMINQLKKMGADIDSVSNRARITGVTRLHGATVYADDLRSGAGLLIAAAMAEGTSVVEQEHYIYRGYEEVETTLRALGIAVRQSE